MPVNEASYEETPYGRRIGSEGWFVLNLGDAAAVRNEEKGGVAYEIEPRDHDFSGLGVKFRILYPGEPNCYYHSENTQEGFLVVAGECTLIVEEQQRHLRQWDYFHWPPETRHVLVGAGEGPCAILMLGERVTDEVIDYPVSELAARYGASVAQQTIARGGLRRPARRVPARADPVAARRRPRLVIA